MNAKDGFRPQGSAWRGRRFLTRASAVLCAIALAVGANGGATAQEPTTPYGWHDGNAGVVTTAWQCSAYGWAVDPEDPDRDLQIQIFADGNPVATTVADQLREDVTDCPGGSCGFGVNLWGLITPGVEHLITAQAYDEETLTWVDLSGTPKPLTCRGYPEGFHDGAAGLVDQYGCAATGWTADPDDRDRDLQVQILADGNPVTTVTADVLREDVGACVGGTCGFFADLWGLIDPDVEHAITAQAYDEESGQWLNLEATPKSLTCQAAPPPTPSIWISTSNDYLRANDFTPEATLTFRVYASEGEADPFLELSLTTDDFGYAFIDGWEHGRDLVVGNYIVASDGTSTRTLVLEPLTVDVFDPATDYVAGTASPGEFVHVVIGNNDVGYPAEMDVYGNGEGEWQADFGGIFDIPWDMWGSADVFDEDGDRTVFHLGASPPPSPRFSVFPEWEWIEGFDWPDDVPIYTSVDGKPECDDSASASGGYFHLELGEDCDIVVGDTVRLRDGTTDRMHIVRNLAITATDAEADTVAGTADVGAVVYVWKHEPGEQVAATADASGNWLADLTGFYDIVPGSEGRSEIRDELGNGTAVDWRASNPRFAAFPEWDFMEGWDWPLGALVHLSIDDPATPADPDYEDDQTVGYHPEDPSTVWVGFELGEYDLKPGDVVTVSYGTTSKVLVVANLAVTWFDLAEGFVGGTGSPELDVHIWVHGVDLSFMITTPDENGDWGVDFDDVGYTVVQGTSGRAEQVDPDSDATAVDWSVPVPKIIAQITDDWIWGQQFTPDSEVTFWVYDAAGGSLALGPEPVQADADGSAFLELRDYPLDLVPGNHVVVSDGLMTHELTLEPISFEFFDLTEGLLTGTAPEPFGRDVWVGIGFEDSYWESYLTSGDGGTWSASFGGTVPMNYRWVSAEVFDEDGDASEVRPSLIEGDVSIDIRPLVSTNLVACRLPGELIPVAVLSTEGFEATVVDHDSVRFGRTGVEAAVVMVRGRPLRYTRDMNGDGLLDMVYTFRFGDTGFSCADVPIGRRTAQVEGILTAYLGPIHLEGRDSLTLFRLLGH